MTILKMIAVGLGLAFLSFGYFIYFRKKYDLINGFTADYEAGRRDERCARRIGLIEFIAGIVLLVAGITMIILV